MFQQDLRRDGEGGHVWVLLSAVLSFCWVLGNSDGSKGSQNEPHDPSGSFCSQALVWCHFSLQYLPKESHLFSFVPFGVLKSPLLIPRMPDIHFQYHRLNRLSNERGPCSGKNLSSGRFRRVSGQESCTMDDSLLHFLHCKGPSSGKLMQFCLPEGGHISSAHTLNGTLQGIGRALHNATEEFKGVLLHH